jgi:hypothetical protein
MTQNETRFLQEIASRIAPERIVEVHLFAPLRLGAVESGVAIVAAGPAGNETTQPEQSGSDKLQARYEIFSARYRLAIKGQDRGRWEFDLALEADAPLLAIDRVVSGVLQRSTEQSEPVRLSGAELRAVVGDVDCVATK